MSQAPHPAVPLPANARPTLGRGVHDLVADVVRDRPDTTAVMERPTGQRVTYRQLWDRSGRLASTLADLGVGRGDVVAVAQPRGVDLVVAFLGILRAGAAYLPVDDHAPADRVAAMLAQAGAEVAVVSADALGSVPAAHLVASPRDGDPVSPRAVPVGGDDPAYVSYTSGSTGRPKGVVVPHRAVIRLVSAPRFCTVRPGDLVAHTSSIAFDATTFELWNALTAGGTVVVPPTAADLPLEEWVSLVREEGITTMFLTTSLFHTVARERPDAFGSLGTLVIGGEQLDLGTVRAVLAAAPPARLVNGYGPTETTTFAAYYDCTNDTLAGLRQTPIGYPLQDTDLHVLDDDLTPVPPGEVGELCVGGPGVALGYLAQPELTAERFVADPASGATLYRTGDAVRQLPGGALELVGRKDRQVKLRGFRVELEEIEHAAVRTGLADAVFVEKVGDGGAAALVGFYLPARAAAGGAESPAAELARRLARQLPDYMVPGRWVPIETVPLGPTGKVDRAQLLDMLPAPADPRTAASQPDTVLDVVHTAWRDVLAVAEADSTKSFLELGGNSILAVQLGSRLSRQLSTQVEPAELLFAESVDEVVEYVRQLRSSES